MVTGYAERIALYCAVFIEMIGIGLITAISLYSLIFAVVRRAKGRDPGQVFRDMRQRLGNGILLGLEFLVAADIIHTVAVELTFTTVGVLALIVLIRTFLSFTLDVELTGRWPWQGTERENSPP